jgi:dTDP-4-dehydrorhamnose reductase
MTTILVLGHKGMLGRAVTQHLQTKSDFKIVTIHSRWGDENFPNDVIASQPDFIINCIGKIPQKDPVESEYHFLNIALPQFLETLNVKVIHPSTDCEFKGDIAVGATYTKTSVRDADDVYGLSKATISKDIEATFTNTKIIRTSIIGHEAATAVSLLDWFLSQTGSVRGYTNHYWNGITTLQWAKQAEILVRDWGNFPALNQVGTTEQHSKFDILNIAKTVYEKDIEITPFATDVTVNKCLLSDTKVPPLEVQLAELKSFFKK